MGTGSTGQTELSRDAISSIKIIVPPLSLQESFSDVVSHMRQLQLSLERSTTKLRITRDLLLPRLISGEIDVTDLDIAQVENAA